ncbi:lipoprotein insertase outer membrane protein LolB [Marinobacter lutaoensis]|jgi:outer membrane lipoprotein LolB|uniref:lipoprotein insertase outer membrane protein LolB n=1 Tax=Marinobacter lutaoensis TaxID=135739 RepID=UPI000C08FFF0|nr:lipoprotein insertase outer membrane protein LolB [Marinobacter lutaoensis]MBE02364.1 outer membrane lipoprotein LolB [Marinobacter sp.]MBI42566.1 outer membrane lipoprotein LolB [Oceanospirillales bacterium]NVD34694.1 outer membrane lipoprotein LolB [Marinobacter lutaoensis]|tara:strand:- start:7157 stop:7798 length:642 start_codon:yes stop_codon:yes gene_type:complete
MTRWFRWLLLPLLATLLQACTSIALAPLPEGMTDQPPADWSRRARTLGGFDHWQLSGKLAVRQPSDSGTALINQWRQEGEHYRLALSSSFLGVGSTSLEGTPGFIELTLPNGDRYQSGDPETLVAAATGWQLPLTSLTWWIRGLPAPEGDVQLLFDDRGQLTLLRQSGWEIRYDRWQAFVPGLPPLPARITALKEDKRVRLVVADWQALEATP